MIKNKINNSDSPKVKILTLNWNGLRHLKYFLPHALRQSYSNYSILVVDNGSSDNSVKYIRDNFPEVEVLSLSKNLGYSRGFNRGIFDALKSGSDYILITNNDVVLHENFLSEGVKLFSEEKNIGYMSGKVYYMNDINKFQYAGGRNLRTNIGKIPSMRGKDEFDVGQYEETCDFEYMDDVCSLVSCQMIKKVGPYDSDFFFDYEETEWNFRIRKGKFRIVYNPKMKAWHRLHGSTGGTRLTRLSELHHCRGKILFHYKTENENDFLSFLIGFVFFHFLKRSLFLICQRKANLIFFNAKGIVSALMRIIILKTMTDGLWNHEKNKHI
ncbi:MAG: hypothetical protein CL678_14730 [Bdellovibrionaceae bacterium]|nr:hypothetical protein [Pseudobdellovibrionaceae bacterium]